MDTNRPHSTKSERNAHIDAWQQSRLSQEAYCKQANINHHTFSSWITKQKLDAAAQNKFLKIELADENGSPEAKTFATLTFSNQFTLQLHKEVSVSFLKQLITCK